MTNYRVTPEQLAADEAYMANLRRNPVACKPSVLGPLLALAVLAYGILQAVMS